MANLSPQATFAANAPSLRGDLVLAVGLAALGLALRLCGLADKAFWFDEILTWGRAKLPLGELVIDALTHKHFPSYFLLVVPFASATQNPEWMLRLPSALCGAVCVFLVTRLAFGARGFAAGLVAGLLMALSPIDIAFAQDARPYALISCFVLIATFGLLRIAQNPEAAARSVVKAQSLRGAWAAYVLGTLGALLIENNTIPFLLASNLAIGLIVLRTRPVRPELARNWAWSQALIALTWLPALFAMWTLNRGTVLEALQWIPGASWHAIQTTAAALYLFRVADMMSLEVLPAPLPQFGILVAAAALFGAWRLKDDPNVLAVLALTVLIMPITVLALVPFQPLLVPRYLLWSTGPFFALAGIGVASLPAGLSAASALAVAVGGAISLAPYYGAETKPQWKEALTYLAENARPDDRVVAQNQTVQVFLASYAARFGLSPRVPILSWVPEHPRESEREASAGEHAWIVYGRVGQGRQEPETDFRHHWADFGAPAKQIRFGSSILVLRFDRPQLRQPVSSVEPRQQKLGDPADTPRPMQ